MYYIYHIPSIRKIGCTTNLVKRVELTQGFSKEEYVVLFITNSIVEASRLEVQSQKKHNYRIDKDNYLTLKQRKMVQHISNQTVTFRLKPSEVNKEFFKGLKIELPSLGVVTMDNDQLCEWACSNVHKSFMLEGSYFIYNKALYNAFMTLSFAEEEEDKCQNEVNVFDLIRDWAQVRGIYNKGDSKTQYVKLMEEVGELAQGILKKDRAEIQDAIGDVVVVLTNLAHLEQMKIEDCVTSAYDEIKDRKGKMVNGTFEKKK
jgi:NTP pyrophosphatase (non-canonical NTP hydrolase)